MRNKVILEKSFERPAKQLRKRYPSFPSDLLTLIEELESNALLGTSIGGNVRKVRLAIRSKGKGKSGGARVITYVYISDSRVHLLTIYDKSDRAAISNEEIRELIAGIGKERLA